MTDPTPATRDGIDLVRAKPAVPPTMQRVPMIKAGYALYNRGYETYSRIPIFVILPWWIEKLCVENKDEGEKGR